MRTPVPRLQVALTFDCGQAPHDGFEACVGTESGRKPCLLLFAATYADRIPSQVLYFDGDSKYPHNQPESQCSRRGEAAMWICSAGGAVLGHMVRTSQSMPIPHASEASSDPKPLSQTWRRWGRGSVCAWAFESCGSKRPCTSSVGAL